METQTNDAYHSTVHYLNDDSIDSRIDEIRNYYNDRIKSAKTIDDKYFQALCLYSLIDSLAQEYSNFSEKQQSKCFIDFALKFNKRFSFLNTIDPVTLYYDVQEHLNKEVNLDNIKSGYIYNPNEIIEFGISQKIIDDLKSKIPEKEVCKYINNHKYVNLLYKMRSKLAHESITPGYIFSLKGKMSLPFYISSSMYDEINGNIYVHKFWELIIPIEFIENLLRECLENYLLFCKESKKDPLSYNIRRKCILAWYP
ncbi:MAG: hypothetical protein AB9835_11205 [Eubacteriales bacterium]